MSEHKTTQNPIDSMKIADCKKAVKEDTQKLGALSGSEFYMVGIARKAINTKYPTMVVTRCVLEDDEIKRSTFVQAYNAVKILGPSRVMEVENDMIGYGAMVRVFTQAELEVLPADAELAHHTVNHLDC